MEQRDIAQTIKFLRRVLQDANKEERHPDRLRKVLPPNGQVSQLLQVAQGLNALAEKAKKIEG